MHLQNPGKPENACFHQDAQALVHNYQGFDGQRDWHNLIVDGPGQLWRFPNVRTGRLEFVNGIHLNDWFYQFLADYDFGSAIFQEGIHVQKWHLTC